MSRNRPTVRDQYATVQAQLTSANRCAAELLIENGKHAKHIIDLQQRNVLLQEQIRLQLELIERLKSQLARTIAAVEIQPSELKLAP